MMARFALPRRGSNSHTEQHITCTRYKLRVESSASPRRGAGACLHRTCGRSWEEQRSTCVPTLASFNSGAGDCIAILLFELSHVISHLHAKHEIPYL